MSDFDIAFPAGYGGVDPAHNHAHEAITGIAADQHHAQNHTDTQHTDGANVKKVGGGKETLQAHGAMGSTETIDLANGNVHTGTLDANVTFTFSGATASAGCSMTLILTQDGTGTRTITWPASVKWAGGAAPTLNTAAGKVSAFTFHTTDGGTTWYGFLAGDDLR